MTKVDRAGMALSPMQVKVLDLVSEGLLNKQIAHKLGISEQTVKTHVTSLLKRRGCTNRVQLAVGWVREQMEQA